MTNIFTLLSTFTGRISRRQWWIGFVDHLHSQRVRHGSLQSRAVHVRRPAAAELARHVLAARLAGARHRHHHQALQRPRLAVVARLCVRGGRRLLYVSPHFGLAIDPEASTAGAASFWLTLALFLAAFLDNGFMRGTRGPNRYGPDPLAPDPRRTRRTDRMKTAADPVALAQALIRCESVTPVEAGALTLLEACSSPPASSATA